MSLKAIDNIYRKQCNKKECDYLDDWQMKIERYEEFLEERFNSAFSENIKILEEIIKYDV